MEISKEEINAIMSLAKKIIQHQSEEKWNKQIRQAEDKYDNMDIDAIEWDDVRSPERCETCND